MSELYKDSTASTPERVEATRLGIPVSMSSDPRHAFTDNPAEALMTRTFSQWPETLGLAAIGDEDITEEFGDIARREYIAVGIRTALHPHIDLATEARWARGNGTFGEDATLTARMGCAYVRGFQGTGKFGEGFGHTSVSAMAKHFPGGGRRG
jgi:beta-glucosidase